MGALIDDAIETIGIHLNRTDRTTRTSAMPTTERITHFRGALSTTPRFYFYNGRYWRLPQEWYAARRFTAYALPRATFTTSAPQTTPTNDVDTYEEGGEEEDTEAEITPN